MPQFRKNSINIDHHEGKLLSKEELDAKKQAALEQKSIISWKSPVRVYKAKSRKYFAKVGLYGFIFVLLAIAIQEYVLAGVVIAVVFVAYVLALAAPETIEHKINNMGIISGGRVFLWEDLDSFWFEKKGDDRVLMVATRLHFPTRLIILLTTVSDRTLLELLERHLHYHHSPVNTLLDKWARKLQNRISLD